MKTKYFFTAKFHRREPGDDAKAGKGRESIRAIVPYRRRDAIQGPPAAALGIAELLHPLVSLGVVANDGSA
jgi:hypothetical protein